MASAEVEPLEWRDLPPKILSKIAQILNTDVDILRLRAVCKHWRSSVRPHLRPSLFPLKIPIFSTTFDGADWFLTHTTLYRISPPEHGPHAGDSSDGWLLRVREVNPNRFVILSPLRPDKPQFPPRTIPNSLNLLDYRITEICKCYGVVFSWSIGSESGSWPVRCIRKTLILSALGRDFVVLTLTHAGILHYWKLGDESCTTIDVKGHVVTDMVLCEGICYAISTQGVLLSLDPELSLSVLGLAPPPVNCPNSEYYLVECNSDLYVVCKTPSSELKVFKKGENSWGRIGCLGDVMFLSSNDVSVGVSAEDFGGKSSCVYVAHVDLPYMRVDEDFAVYRLDGDTSSVTKLSKEQMLCWPPPPAWLVKIAKDVGTEGSSG